MNLAHTHWTVAQYLLDPNDSELTHCIQELVAGSRLSEQPDPKRSGSTALHDAAAGAYSLGVAATAMEGKPEPVSVRYPRYLLTNRKQEKIAAYSEWRRHVTTTIPNTLTLICSALQLRDLTSCAEPGAQVPVADVSSDPDGPPAKRAEALALLSLTLRGAFGKAPLSASELVAQVIALRTSSSTAQYNLACFAARQADFLARSGRNPTDPEQAKVDAGALGRLEHALLHSAPDRRERLLLRARTDVALQGLAFRRSAAFDRIVPPVPDPEPPVVADDASSEERAAAREAAAEALRRAEQAQAARADARAIVMRWANPDRGNQLAIDGLLQRTAEAFAQMELTGAAARHAALVRADERVATRLRAWWSELPDGTDRSLLTASVSRALFLSEAQVARLVR